MPAKIYQCQTCGERFVALTLRKCPSCREPVPDSVLASGAKVIDFMQRAQQAARPTRRAGAPRNALTPLLSGEDRAAIAASTAPGKRPRFRPSATPATAVFGQAEPEGPGLGPRLVAFIPGLLSSFGIVQLPAFAGLNPAWKAAAITLAPWLFTALIELSLQSRERVLTGRERIATYWIATLWYTGCILLFGDLFLGLTGLLLIPFLAPRIVALTGRLSRRRRHSGRRKS